VGAQRGKQQAKGHNRDLAHPVKQQLTTPVGSSEAVPGALKVAVMFGSGCPHVMAEQYLLDALGAGCSDALVDTEGLPQASDACGCVAVLEVAAADAFQGARFLQRRARARPSV
jgi:hypothetical protein